ncbi:MAG: heme-binding beta-barrel domain-containing protein [Mariprofundales bacterium]|nr:heme-binding beta-barrel domain-containing protein [Mariprofundales bacterium]
MGATILNSLGPLAVLEGSWQGEDGVDTSPGRDGAVESRYREQLSFTAIAPVESGSQTLYGLRYSTTAWPLDAEDPFHEESGYWLWDAHAEQVMRCFMVPRGVTILAGGSTKADSGSFSMRAEVGSDTFGILSNPYLDREFKTVCYELQVDIHDDNSFSYEEDTQLKIRGINEVFHHTDRNRLIRV